jgi:hypothetical protein
LEEIEVEHKLDQSVICSLLSYFGHGNVGNLSRIIELSTPATEILIPYLKFNVMSALSIAGLIEVVEYNLKREWSVAFASDIEVNGQCPKLIPTTAASIEKARDSLFPLICDSFGRTLISGSFVESGEGATASKVLSATFTRDAPLFKNIESQICREEEYPELDDDAYERYDFNRWAWRPSEGSMTAPSMIRVKGEFGERRHYVVFPQLHIAFQLTHPEWIHFAAIHLMGWTRTQAFKVVDGTLLIERSFRVPTIILRYLFASSRGLCLGPQVKCLGITGEAVDTVCKLFSVEGQL